jgi:sucrose-6-phosphate hydrolase SacC (GH32 family)
VFVGWSAALPRRIAAGEKAGGAKGTAVSPPSPKVAHLPPLIADKTLVAWISPTNLNQRGGSALTIDDQNGRFDGIVFGELAPGKWMAGSDFFQRSQKDQKLSAAETADAKTVLQVAVVYQGRQVALYRNGRPYARYTIDKPQTFGPESAILIGLRHFPPGKGKYFAGTVEDARVYDRALDAGQLAALRPNEASQPRPWAWFAFRDGKAVDRTGRFSVVELSGGAEVIGGCLRLNGRGAYLAASQPEPAGFVSPIHYRPRRGVFADPIPFFHQGQYHVFYLRGGIGRVPWEHIVSTDLVHWRELPPALVSDGEPSGPDGGQMFTGSVVEGEGRFHIFYTGDNGANPQGTEFIMHATSADLVKWTKHPEDMIAPDGRLYKNARVRDFRDPYVFWNAEEKRYWMVFFANDAKTGQGVQGLAVSKDLKRWEFQRPLLGVAGQECPDLFKIAGTWYLIGGGCYYYGSEPRGPFQKAALNNVIDRPFIYAAKRTFDGQRQIWTGWLWDRAPRCDRGRPCWGGTQCLPREVYPGPGGRLYCRPVPEVSALFTKTVLDLAGRPALAAGSGGWDYVDADLRGRGREMPSTCTLKVPDHYMLECKIRLDPQAVFTLTMRQTEEPGSGYRLVLRPGRKEAELSSSAFREPRLIELDASRPIAIRAFVQGSMMEVFINDRFALSCRGYDYPAGDLGLGVAGGDVRLLELKAKVPGASALQGPVKPACPTAGTAGSSR